MLVAIFASLLIGCAAPNPAPGTEQSAEQIGYTQPQQALVLFNTIIAQDPRNARALSHRAALYNRIGRNELAVADLDRADSIDNGMAYSLTVRALVLQQSRPKTEILADVSRAIALLSTKGKENLDASYAVLDAEDRAYVIESAFTLRAEIRKHLHQMEGALADADAVIDFDPEMTSALLIRASIERMLYRFPAALQDDLKAMTLHDHQEGVSSLCADYSAQGSFEDAERKCNEALTLFPRNNHNYLSRGVAYLKAGRLEAANSDFDAALKLFPRDSEALYGKGLILRLEGITEAADTDMGRALATEPDVNTWFAARGVRSPVLSHT